MDLLFGSTSAGLVIRRPCDLDGRAAPLRGAARVRDAQPSLCSGTRSPGPRESSTAGCQPAGRDPPVGAGAGRSAAVGRTWRAVAWDGTVSRRRFRTSGIGLYTLVLLAARASRRCRRPAGRATMNGRGPARPARRSTVPSGGTRGLAAHAAWRHTRPGGTGGVAAQAAWRHRRRGGAGAAGVSATRRCCASLTLTHPTVARRLAPVRRSSGSSGRVA